jgi:predicted Zn-dependent peptidase
MRDIWGLTTPGKEGFGALATALVLQGADAGGQADFIERLKDLAASASLSVGPFSTQGSVRAPTASLAAATALFAAALKSGEPNEKLVARLKQRASGGEAQAALRAETIAQRAALWLALGDHPITRGFDPGRFDRISAGDVSAWRNSALDRSRLRLVASGRISKSEAMRIVDDAFADIPTRRPLPLVDWQKPQIDGGTVVVEQDTPQSAIFLVGLTTIGAGREVETANVANAVLGGSNGRLWQGVRASLGSTYGAGSTTMLAGPGVRLITLRAAVANDQVKATLEALKRAYATWQREGASEAELKATTSRMMADMKAALDDPSRANGLVIGMQLAGRPVEDIYTFGSRLGAITRAKLNQFIGEKFPPVERLLAVVVTPRGYGLDAMCTIRSAEEARTCRKAHAAPALSR